MKLSVIIPTFHRPELLQALLQVLCAQKNPDNLFAFEVIVADDAAEEQLHLDTQGRAVSDIEEQVEAVQKQDPEDHCHLRCVTTRGNQGPGIARNIGVEVATGDFVVFMDDDCLVEADWLMTLAKAIQAQPDIDVFFGPVTSGGIKSRYPFLHAFHREGQPEQGANIAIRKSAFDAVGGFDPALSFWGEDQDLVLRLQEAGHRFLYLPDWHCLHPPRYDSPKYPGLVAFQEQLGRFRRFLIKHQDNADIHLRFLKWQRYGSRALIRLLFWMIPAFFLSTPRTLFVFILLNIAYDAFKLLRIQQYLNKHGFAVSSRDALIYLSLNWWHDVVELLRLTMLAPAFINGLAARSSSRND